MRKSKGKCKIPSLNVDGKIIRDPKEIAENWADYFENLHMPYETTDNDEQASYIVTEINKIVENSNDEDDIFSTQFSFHEVADTIYQMPNGKAPGHDKVCYEHIKFAGTPLLYHLVFLYNSIVALESIPACFKLALKIPIPKGGGKRSQTFDDHRGISLLPVLDKILQKLVLNRILKLRK